jgi:putative two-component system response regulator
MRSGKDLAVLVVDDDFRICEMARAALENHGFRVSTRHRPLEALELLKDTRFDVILLDLVMAELSGGEVLAQLLQQDPNVVVLLMSGDPELEHGRLPAGAYGFLAKPLSFPRVCQAIERAAAESELRGEHCQVHQFIRGLANAIEAKDHFTRGHSERVVHVTSAIAAALGLSESERRVLKTASVLHDIGKIGIPDAILLKPGPLTADEWNQVKQHPEIGSSILKPIPNLDDVRQCVLEHHEKWDGSGYPRGLRGEEVSLPGRILILAEVFDALAHERSYKPAWSLGHIIEYFEFQSGKHFDPRITPRFIDLLKRTGRNLGGASATLGSPGAKTVGERGVCSETLARH